MSRSSKNRQRIRFIAAICLVGTLILLLWNRHGAGSHRAHHNDQRPENPRRTGSPTDIIAPGGSHAHAPPVTPGTPPGQHAGPSIAVTGPDYEAEEFTHVPDWMPRPVAARSARAIDASLRSDGFVEGTLRYGFGPEHAGALDDIMAQLEAAGMSPDPSRSVFSSDDPPRRCEIRVETAPDGAMILNLFYQGTDHEKGCTCPTCGKSPENPEP